MERSHYKYKDGQPPVAYGMGSYVWPRREFPEDAPMSLLEQLVEEGRVELTVQGKRAQITASKSEIVEQRRQPDPVPQPEPAHAQESIDASEFDELEQLNVLCVEKGLAPEDAFESVEDARAWLEHNLPRTDDE